METSTWEQKERVLRMILKLKNKRKPAKVLSQLEVDGQPSILFPANLEHLDYRDKTEFVRENLQKIIDNS